VTGAIRVGINRFLGVDNADGDTDVLGGSGERSLEFVLVVVVEGR
jgi:hypothetical protein